MFENACRLCTKTIDTHSKYVKLFEKHTHRLLQQIELFIGLLLPDAPNMPNNVCLNCLTQLRKSLTFRQSVITAQQVLEDNALAIEDTTDDYAEVYLEEKPATAILQKEPKLKIETITNKAEEEKSTEQIYEENINEENFFLSTNVDEECNAPKKIKQCGLSKCDEIENNEESNALRNKRGTGKTIFICDHCGNHIKGRFLFEIHLRRHLGLKLFKCELCPDSFCSQSALGEHMRRHTRERRFVCRYCDRRFTDCSSRIRHERTHTNERPFVCARCGKAFTESNVLKNHMLTHTGERLFKCEQCNKSFLRQTHLTTHYRSISHKNKAPR